MEGEARAELASAEDPSAGERSGGQIQEILRCLEQKIKTTLDYPRLSGCLFKYTFS